MEADKVKRTSPEDLQPAAAALLLPPPPPSPPLKVALIGIDWHWRWLFLQLSSGNCGFECSKSWHVLLRRRNHKGPHMEEDVAL